MQKSISALLGLSLCTYCAAAEPKAQQAPAPAAPAAIAEAKAQPKPEPEEKKPAPPSQASAKSPAPKEAPKKKSPPKIDPQRSLNQLTLENNLETERQKKATAALRAEVARLKLEKEALGEKLALESLKIQAREIDKSARFEAEKNQLTREAEMAKLQADLLTNQLKATQARASLETTELKALIENYETRKQHDAYADAEPVYLDNPLKKDGTLVISDRRIALNGPIGSRTADEITARINYYNNKDPKKPIFIVIDDSPGGSVMAGYRILKSMEGSQAPVYVVVKSFAASMAACIATLAEKSYAYPNAMLLHHQISTTLFGRLNLTEQKEFYQDSQKWWKRLAEPVAQKMGISTDEFIKKMYQRSSNGDWTEFADEAQKLKWVDHIVTNIHKTSLLHNPDQKRPAAASPSASDATFSQELDEDGKPVVYLPRLNPKDVYFLYNPDGYYRLR
ncbi:MAG: ATP-dependent Clp protease proteolytic subunit [Verrucomicrobiales bacterium]